MLPRIQAQPTARTILSQMTATSFQNLRRCERKGSRVEEVVAEKGWRLLPVFGGECTGHEDNLVALLHNTTVDQDLKILASRA